MYFNFSEIPEEGDTVTACTGVPNGDYQSAVNCNQYITCYYGAVTTNTCPENQYWDDALKRCDFASSTCTDGRSLKMWKMLFYVKLLFIKYHMFKTMTVNKIPYYKGGIKNQIKKNHFSSTFYKHIRLGFFFFL